MLLDYDDDYCEDDDDDDAGNFDDGYNQVPPPFL